MLSEILESLYFPLVALIWEFLLIKRSSGDNFDFEFFNDFENSWHEISAGIFHPTLSSVSDNVRFSIVCCFP